MSEPHDHDHDHGHSHDHIPLKPAPSPIAEPIAATAPQDESASQALSDALSSSFAIVKVVMVILVVVFFARGIFTVPSQQKAIILRFGKPIGVGAEQLLGPGLHWSFPYPIDEVKWLPVGEIQRVTSTAGWYATTPELEASNSESPAGPSLNPGYDGYTLTADGNIIHVRATLSYRISDPLTHEFNFVKGSNVVQQVLDGALFHTSSLFTVDQLLTTDKVAFQEKLLANMRNNVEQKKLGIVIEQAEIRIIPPRQVKPAFDLAFGADIERRKALEDARSYAGRILSTASGEANSITNAARTDFTRLVQAVAAEARYFQDQLPYYKADPGLFAARLQTEMLGRAMTNVQDKWISPQSKDGKQRELRIQLSREPKVPTVPGQDSNVSK